MNKVHLLEKDKSVCSLIECNVSIYEALLYNLFHDLQLLSNGELRVCLVANFLDFNSRGKFGQGELASHPVDLEDTLHLESEAQFWPERLTYQVSNDRAHHIGASQWQAALLHDLGRAVFCDVTGCNHDFGLIGIGDQVHCTAHALEDFARNHIVGQIAIGAHLESLEESELAAHVKTHLQRDLLQELIHRRDHLGSYRMTRCYQMSRHRGPMSLSLCQH